MPEYTPVIALVIGLIALAVIGIQDLRYRRVDWEWLYVVIIVCGLFTGGSWIEKIAYMIIFPTLLFAGSYLFAKKRAKKTGEKASVELALSYFGGADLKIVASTGFMMGPMPLAITMVLAIILSIPFLFFPSLGLKNKEDTPERHRTPFGTAVALSAILFYAVMFGITAYS